MALDNATVALLTELAKLGGKPLHECTPVEARAFLKMLNAGQPEGPSMESVTTHKIDVADGQIDAIVLKPSASPEGVIVYYHGGGWVIGDAQDFQLLGKIMAEKSNCVVVLVNYRKAPEYAYPVPVNDAYTALQWVEEHMLEIAGNTLPIIVSGDSAGGNLSAAMTLKARNENGPVISFQALIYPVTHDDLENDSYLDPANQLILEKRTMEWFWDHYVPNKEDRKEIYASPLYEKDLSGLPDAVVITAGHDVLRQEGEAYAANLIRAGVNVSFKRFPDQMHGFYTMVVLPGSSQGLDFVCQAIRKHLKEKTPATV